MEDLELNQDTVILNEPNVDTVEGAEEALPLVIGELDNITDEIELTQSEPMIVSLETNSVVYSVDPTVPNAVRTITEDQIESWDYASFTAHEHDNKDVLDEITAPYTEPEKEKLAHLHNYDDTNIANRVDIVENKVNNLHNYDDTEVKGNISVLQSSVASLHNYDDTDVKKDINVLQSRTEQINNTLSQKVDKIGGKGLSTNDYTTAEKNKLASLYNYNDTDLQNRVDTLEDTMPTKVDKIDGKGLSTNDYTNEDKTKLSSLVNYDDSSLKSSVKNVVDTVELLNDRVDNTYTKSEVDTKIASLDIPTDYVIHSELTPYATKTWVEDKIKGIDNFATREWVNEQMFLKEHQDLSAYAKKTDIPSLQGYATERYVVDTIREAQGEYATESWVESKGYATQTWVKDEIGKIQPVPTEDMATKTWVNEQMFAKLSDIPTNVSAFTNDSGYLTEHQSLDGYATEQWVENKHYLTEHQDISNKYDKAGGNISGNVDIDGNLIFNIEDEDYDAGIRFIAKPLDDNRATILRLQGFANGQSGNTNYKVAIENVATPVNDFDAVNKKYVDDKTSITWITGFYDEQGLYVSSSAYNDCYNGITSNHTVYLKVTEAGQVSILRLKSWLNFNAHSSGEDSFFFVDAIDLNTNKTATISKSSATFNTLDLEMIGNKTTEVEMNKDSDTLYPTTKATYDFVEEEFERRKPVVIYDKVDKLKVSGTLVPSLDSDKGLLATGSSGYTDKYNITGLDLSKFREIKFVYLRDSTNTGTTAEFIIPLDYPIANKKTGVGATDYGTQYVASGSTLSFGDRNRFNCCQASVCVPIGGTLENCSISVNQYFSLYGTAATTLNSDIYVVRIYGIY